MRLRVNPPCGTSRKLHEGFAYRMAFQAGRANDSSVSGNRPCNHRLVLRIALRVRI